MLEYEIRAVRMDSHGSIASCKQAELLIDTDIKGRDDAFNPAELLLAAVAACILKNMERIAPVIHFEYRDVTVRLNGTRQDSPPMMTRIDYEIIVDCDENDHQISLMHDNIRKFGTIYNTIVAACEVSGTLRRLQ